MEKYSKGEIAKIILKSLLVTAVVVTVVALPGSAQILTLFKPKNKREEYKVTRSLHSLKKNKYVRVYKKNGKDIIEITRKGKRRISSYDYEDIKLQHVKKWDGLWRVVMFDIPERKKRARNAISRKLKELGCHAVQKSVFIYPYDCRKEMDFIAGYLYVRKYIQYMEVKKVDNEGKIKKRFHIK